MVRFYLVAVFFIITSLTFAQNNFRSKVSGDWNQSGTWEEFIAGSWQSTGNTPTSVSGSITIQTGNVVTVTQNVSADQATVQTGGSLILNDGVVLTINNGVLNDLTVSGTIEFLGESFISGGGNFVLNGTLKSGSLNATGAIVTGTTAGNIRVSSRTYNPGSAVIYNGLGAQFIGNGHPAANATTEIDNASGITFTTTTPGNSGSSRLFLGSTLTLTSGDLNIISSSTVARILYLNGNVTANGNFITFAGPNVDLYVAGSGSFGAFPFPSGAQTIRSLFFTRTSSTLVFNELMTFVRGITTSGAITFNQATTIGSTVSVNSTGAIDFNDDATLKGSLNMTNGTLVSFQGQTLSLAGNFNSSGGELAANSASTLSLTGSLAHTTPLQFSASANTLGQLTINKSNATGVSVRVSSPLTITTLLTLTNGELDIVGNSLSLNSGATLSKAGAAAITTSSPSGGPWNLEYTGTSSTTAFEIPESGTVSSLSINTNTSSIVTLTQALTVTGSFSNPNTGRTFTAGANALTVKSFTNGGTFNAPSTTLTITNGDFINNRTFNHNGGEVIIGGSTTMSGTLITTTNFNDLTINSGASLTAPAVLNIFGAFVNNGTFNAANGKVVFNNPTTTLTGTSINSTNFFDVTIQPTVTLTPGTTFILSGTLLINGTFVTTGGTLICNGNCNLTGGHVATTTFNNIVINASATLTAPATFNIAKNFTNNGAFVSGTSTEVFTGTTVLSGSQINSTVFGGITINNGAQLTAPTTLTLTKNFLNNGIFVVGVGTVVFAGTTIQTIISASPITFNNITITNSTAVVRVESNQNLKGVLTLASNAQFDADGASNNKVLKILSTSDAAASDGSVATLPTGAKVLGDVTVQRYFGIKDDKDRFISSPVKNAAVSELQNSGVLITGSFTGTSYPCTGCDNNGSNLKYYDESEAGVLTKGYIGFPGTTNTDTLKRGYGYALYMWNGVAPTQFELRGPINTGTIPFTTVSFHNTGNPNADGWNLIGNPYPSSVQWNSTGWTRSGISAVVWVWDVTAELWRSCNFNTPNGGNLPNCKIATGEAFWVQATSATPSLSIKETAKVSPGAAFYRERGPSIEGITVSLGHEGYTDNAYIYMNPDGTNDVDRGLDAYKLETGIERMSVSLLAGASNKKLLEFVTNDAGFDREIPIGIAGKDGSYELSFQALGSNFKTDGLYLVDKYQNTVTKLSDTYSFELNNNVISRENRFFISRKAEQNIQISTETLISYYPNPVTNTLYIDVSAQEVNRVSLVNSMGQLVQDVVLEDNLNRRKGEIKMSEMNGGIYFVKVITTNKGVHTYKIVKN
jgi:hypothetical protein